MPLYKKKEVPLLPLPDLSPEKEVWLIRDTGEIFDTYEGYIKRRTFLDKKVFSCSRAGYKNLTYAKALESERREESSVNEKFLKMWIKPFADIVSYNTTPLVQLVDQIYEYFGKHFFAGDQVYVRVNLKKIPFIVVSNVDSSNLQKIIQEHSPDVSLIKPESNEDIYLLTAGQNNSTDDSSKEAERKYLAPCSCIKREKSSLSKKNFRKFIRTIAEKDIWIGAPWIIRDSIVEKYGLPAFSKPDNADLLMLKAHKRSASSQRGDRNKLARPSRKKTKGESPGKSKTLNMNENGEMHQQVNVDSNDSAYSVPEKPPVPQVLNKILPEGFGHFVELWVFLNSFNEILNIDQIIFDDFVEIINMDYSEEVHEKISQVFESLLYIILLDFSSKLPDANSRPDLNQDLESAVRAPHQYSTNEQSENPEEFQSYTGKVDDGFRLYIENYNQLHHSEKVALDEWRTLRTKNPTHPDVRPHKKLKIKGEKRKWEKISVQNDTDVQYNSWEIALVGFVRDHISCEYWSKKWDFINYALQYCINTRNGQNTDIPSKQHQNTDTKQNGPKSEGINSDDAENNSEKDVKYEDGDSNDYESDSVYRRTRLSTKPAKVEVQNNVKFNLRARSHPINYALSRRKQLSTYAPHSNYYKAKKQSIQTPDLPKGCRKSLSQLSTNDRIFLFRALINRIYTMDKLREYISAYKEKRKHLKKKKRILERKRKLLHYIKENLQNHRNGVTDKESGSDHFHHKKLKSRNRISDDEMEDMYLNGPEPLEERIETINSRENALRIKEKNLEREILKSLATKSIMIIGRDRYNNRYWWFDEILGCPILETLGENPEGTQNDLSPKTIPETPNEWLCGILFVEIINPQGKEGEVDEPNYCDSNRDEQSNIENHEEVNHTARLESGAQVNHDSQLDPTGSPMQSANSVTTNQSNLKNDINPNPSMPENTQHDTDDIGAHPKLANTEESSHNAHLGGINEFRDNYRFREATWRMYCGESEVEHLIRWLNPKNPQEDTLLRELKKMKIAIMYRMKKRRDYLRSTQMS